MVAMPSYVALLRSVNVKPRWVKMERLRAAMTDAGYAGVETHIQSGNVYFETTGRSPDRVAAALETLLAEEFGFQIPVILRRPTDLGTLVAAYDELEPPAMDPPTEPGDLRPYVVFLTQDAPTELADALTQWALPGERAVVLGRHAICWYAGPVHAAKLPTHRIWRSAVGPVTSRDLKVVRALAQRWGGPVKRTG